MTVSIPLVSNKQLAAYRKAGKAAPKTTKLFINTGQTVDNKGREVVVFSELQKKGNGNRHIETGRGSIHTSNRVLDSQFVPNTVQPLGLKTVNDCDNIGLHKSKVLIPKSPLSVFLAYIMQ